MAVYVSPGKTPVAGERSPQCARTFWVDLVSSCSVCLSWSPEMCSGKDEMILLDSLFLCWT